MSWQWYGIHIPQCFFNRLIVATIHDHGLGFPNKHKKRSFLIPLVIFFQYLIALKIVNQFSVKQLRTHYDYLLSFCERDNVLIAQPFSFQIMQRWTDLV